MTASAKSLANIIANTVGKDWDFFEDPAPGVLDFVVDSKQFRLIVLDEAETIEGVAVYRSTDVEEPLEEAGGYLSDEELEEIHRAQELAGVGEPEGYEVYPSPEVEPLGYTSADDEEAYTDDTGYLDNGDGSDDPRFGDAQAAEFELGGEG